MLKHLCVLAVAIATVQAAASPPPPLIGVWVEVNGPGAARIASCASAPDQLCATGLTRQPGGAWIDTGLVMTGIRPDGANRWRGLYLDGTKRLGATLRLIKENRVEMTVCVFVFCQSATYTRSAWRESA